MSGPPKCFVCENEGTHPSAQQSIRLATVTISLAVDGFPTEGGSLHIVVCEWHRIKTVEQLRQIRRYFGGGA